jgi:hypothetical protein
MAASEGFTPERASWGVRGVLMSRTPDMGKDARDSFPSERRGGEHECAPGGAVVRPHPPELVNE